MKLTLFGATGATGKLVLSKALAEDFSVTAFVRDVTKLKTTNPLLNIVQGNVSDYHAVNRALQGSEAVISTLGASSPLRFDQSIIDGIENIIRGVQENRIKRFLYMSAIGVKGSRKRAGLLIRLLAPSLLRTETRGHEIREEMITHQLSNWTIVQAPTLTNGPGTGTYVSGELLRSKSFFNAISRADVADFLIKELIDGRYIGKTVSVMKEANI